ncbi:MAG TPA: TSUP family transporter [Solirubrobacteraceae bacterium]|nr:TSUP family transporter [Solirubrobacteraceae bacterium]
MIAEAIAAGLVAGVVSGMFGVGGGVVFVPALVFIYDVGQVEAEATSLLAIIPVALIGAWRQHGYGNVRVREGAVMGVLAAGGALAGVALANALSERTLEIAFAGLMVAIAVQLARDALKEG